MGLFSKGKKEKAADTTEKNEKKDTQKDYWVCPKCGTHNALTSRSCKDCAYYR